MREERCFEIDRCDRCGASGPVIVTQRVYESGKVVEKRACTAETACRQRQATAATSFLS